MRVLSVSDPRRGIENQAIGLAEAICREAGHDCEHQHHTIFHGSTFAALPPQLQLIARRNYGLPDADLIIGCGRQAIAPLLATRQANPRPYTVYIQDPRIEPSRFDLVVMPTHDGEDGAFVETMIGSPNRVTRERIIAETLHHAERLSALSFPRAMIAIGGPSKRHDLTEEDVIQHLQAAEMLRQQGYALLITTSRRTPDPVQRQWESFAEGQSDIWLHRPDALGDNPYFAFLGGADILLATEDSTNMLTELCGTGKPVFRLPMSGNAGKFETLYADLKARCHVVRWDGNPDRPSYAPLDETSRVAQAVIARFRSGRMMN